MYCIVYGLDGKDYSIKRGEYSLRILHYIHGLPPVRGGGLIKYALDLAEGELELGNDVQLLLPGNFSAERIRQTKIVSRRWDKFFCHYIINPLPVTGGVRVSETECLLDKGDSKVYSAFLLKLHPDIIHVHSLMGMHLAFVQEANRLNIPLVFSSHDYYGLCPKTNLFKDEKMCTMQNWDRCAQCLDVSVSKKKLQRKHSDVYRMIKGNKFYNWMEYSQTLLPYKVFLRRLMKKKNQGAQNISQYKIDEAKRYEALRAYSQQIFKNMTYFHFNSMQSREIYESFLGRIEGEVIPITNRWVEDNRKICTYSGKLKIGYLSSGQKFKGYEYLKNSLDEMYRNGMTEIECHIYFNLQDLNCPYVCRHVPYKGNNLESVFRNIDVVVVPSLWKETFGMVVLEALSYGVPVIVSSNVGAKELLEENPGMGIIVNLESGKENLQKVLEKIYLDRNILSRMNKKICKWNRDWSFNKHVKEILDMYSKVC